MYFDQSAASGVGGLHVGNEVAERVYHEYILLMRIIVNDFHRLDYVRMTSDDHVDSLVGEESGETALRGVFFKYVFDAPVNGDADEFGSGIAGD